jgi:hypothetical protein
MTWVGIGHFVGGLSFCFFPAAPAFWLVGHFVGGGRILCGIWLLMFAWCIRISWRMARRREADRQSHSNFKPKIVRNQRYVPILSGIFDLAVVFGLFLFWSPESGGFWWWVRGVPVAVFLYMGIGSLKRGFFASDTEITRMVAGEYDAKDSRDGVSKRVTTD